MPVDVLDKLSEMKLTLGRVRLLKLLQNGPLTPAQICDALGASVQLVCFDLKRKLVPAGLVERQARTYALTKAGAKLVKNI